MGKKNWNTFIMVVNSKSVCKIRSPSYPRLHSDQMKKKIIMLFSLYKGSIPPQISRLLRVLIFDISSFLNLFPCI